MDCRTTIDAVLRDRTSRSLAPGEAADSVGPAAQRELAAHAAICPRCRAEARLATAIEAALSADPVLPPGEDFTRRVLARVRAAERPPRPARAAAWPAELLVRIAPAGAIAATIAGVVLVGPLVGGGSALLDLLTRPLPPLDPATWVSLAAGTGVSALGLYEATRFFTES